MIAKDILPGLAEITGTADLATNMDYLSDALEVMTHKGNWDALQAYLDIPMAPDNLVVLPPFVEDVLKCNINNKPAFSRGKLFEFRQNTDGTVFGDETGATWADRGEQPLQVMPQEGVQLRADTHNAVRVYGFDMNGNRVFTNGEDGYTVTTQLEGPHWKKIDKVKKYKTNSYVNLYAGQDTVATLEPRDHDPLYRVIKISKAGSAVRLLVRRRSYIIQSEHDWIPCQSRVALRFIVRSLFEARRKSDINEVQYYEKQGLQYLQDSQDFRNAHSRISDETEVLTVTNTSYETSDCVKVADIYDEAAKIFGDIGREKVFDKITDSISLLVNEGNWNGTTAWLDVSAAKEIGNCGSQPTVMGVDTSWPIGSGNEFTLPTWVETVLKVNIGGIPTTMHDKWFNFHRNGPGDWGSIYTFNVSDRGQYPTVKDLTSAARLAVQLDTAMDDNIQIRVYGYDENNNELYHEGDRGVIIPAIYGNSLPDPNLPKISRIDRVVKEKSKGYVRVFAYEEGRPTVNCGCGTAPDPSSTPKLISLFRPEETENLYRRLRIPRICDWVRILVKKKTYRISSFCDVIPLRDRNALYMAMQAKAALDAGNVSAAMDLKAVAIDLLSAEEEAVNGPAGLSIEVDPTMAPGSMYRYR